MAGTDAASDIDIFEYTYDLLRQVPKGMVTSYSALAEALGDVAARRAVGVMMSVNPYAPEVACHRVVCADGTLGGFTGGIGRKVEMLAREGVRVIDGRVQGFESLHFADFRTERPLRRLAKLQGSIAAESARTPPIDPGRIERVAGVDVAYPNEREGIAGAAVVSHPGGEVKERLTNREPVKMPYVPGYLGFREAPLAAASIGLLDIRPDVILVDGNGALHPRRCGTATYLGHLVGIPTVGVAKSRLLGENGNERSPGCRELLVAGKIAGFELAPKASRRPLYVSPGWGVTLETALEVVRGQLGETRMPRSIALAHGLARSAVSRWRSAVNKGR